MRSHVFRIFEYEEAEARVIGRCVDAMARLKSPILAQLRSEPGDTAASTGFATDDGTEVTLEPRELRMELTIDRAAIRTGDLAPIVEALDVSAANYGAELVGLLVATMESVTTATGNTVDAEGRPLFDAVKEMLEIVEMAFDDDGKPTSSLFMHPDTFARFHEQASTWTPEQHAELTAIVDRKREAFRASRRTRRLS